MVARDGLLALRHVLLGDDQVVRSFQRLAVGVVDEFVVLFDARVQLRNEFLEVALLVEFELGGGRAFDLARAGDLRLDGALLHRRGGLLHGGLLVRLRLSLAHERRGSSCKSPDEHSQNCNQGDDDEGFPDCLTHSFFLIRAGA